ncbi:MAG: helix-turn-helix domain-containing protein [Candidatus Caldarchaeum sp.]
MKREVEEAVDILHTVFGLNTYQAKAYVAVLSGCRSAKDVSSKTGIPLTRVYDTLKRLSELGLVVKTAKGFKPLESRYALTNLLEKQRSKIEMEFREKSRKLEKFLRMAELFSEAEEAETDTAVLKGLEPVLVKTMEVCSRGSTLVFAVRKAVRLKQEFKKALQNISSKNVMFLVHPSVTIDDQDREFLSMLGAKVVETQALLLDMLVSDVGEALIGLPLDEEPVAVWVKHKGFAGSLLEALTEMLKSQDGGETDDG